MPIRDRGLARITRAFERLEEAEVLTGLQGDLDSHEVLKGFWTEYGTSKMPEWAWMRKTVFENEDQIKRVAAGMIRRMILETQAVDEQTLRRLGIFMEGLMKKQIRKTTTPPIKESTARKKGSDKPLIDTGRMINNIRSEVIL